MVLTNFNAEKMQLQPRTKPNSPKRPMYPRNIFLGSNAILKARKYRASHVRQFSFHPFSPPFFYSTQCFRSHWLLNTMLFIQPCSEVDKLTPLTAKREAWQFFYMLVDKLLFAIGAVYFWHFSFTFSLQLLYQFLQIRFPFSLRLVFFTPVICLIEARTFKNNSTTRSNHPLCFQLSTCGTLFTGFSVMC